MKKIICLIAIVCVVAFSASVASATLITFTDSVTFNKTGTTATEDLNSYGWGDANKLDGAFDYIDWTHHFSFESPVESIISGTLSITLADDSRDYFMQSEFAFGYAEDGSWGLGEVDSTTYAFNINPAFLLDGLFRIVMIDLGGDFFITQSDLTVSYNTSAKPVPEPGTILLIGMGLLGLEFRSRKLYPR